MRIQHNIAALNSYSQLTSNNNAVSKNLEKLSSGYKINRAGDDAAGLAISEKMRAQITGLETAKKNASDGISLVQTAEGALTEVHSMLNRMVELADQSANGTYQNDVDRENIMKEVKSLKAEIDRISEGTNFNGINLLDGSLGSSAGAKVAVDVKFSALSDNPDVLKLNKAEATKSVVTMDSAKLTNDSSAYSLEVTYSDENGELKSKTVDFTSAATHTAGDNDDVVKDALKKAFGDDYTVALTGTDDEISITANKAGADNKMEIYKVTIKDATGTELTGTSAANTAGTDAYYTLDTTKIKSYSGATGEDASNFTFEINGQKFAFATAEGAKKLGADVNYIESAGASPVDAEVASMVKLVNNKTGIGAEQDTTVKTSMHLKAGKTGSTTSQGLTLQIGDSSDKFNKITVSVGDMSTKSLGIAGIDLSTQPGASAAIDSIKSAINSVSSTRGDLGAIQNRLEHTINSLGVTSENMTAAESRIRDVDMASEMMNYTKNNILVQASQAMLAQANQLPQGVLQLLK
jgi:flagellin